MSGQPFTCLISETNQWINMKITIIVRRISFRSAPTDRLSHSMMQQLSWQVRCSSGQEIPHFCRIQNSLLCSQNPTNGPYYKPFEWSPHHHILFLYYAFQYYPLTYA